MNPTRKTPPLKTVEKALDILTCVAESPVPLTATALAGMVNLSLSSVYKFLSTLVDKDYLFFDPISKQYQVSTRALRISYNLRSSQRLSQISLPFMLQLANMSSETVHLAIPQGINAVFLEKINSLHTVGVQTKIGTIARMDKGATPQVLLAYGSEYVFQALCKQIEKEEGGPEKIRQLSRLCQEIRNQGYAISLGQLNDGVVAIAAPIFDACEDVVASLAIAAPDVRSSIEQIRMYIPLLLEVAHDISLRLGYPENGKYPLSP